MANAVVFLEICAIRALFLTRPHLTPYTPPYWSCCAVQRVFLSLTGWNYDCAKCAQGNLWLGWILKADTPWQTVPFPAVAFKNAKMLEEAKEAYLQEAEAHTNNKTYPSTTYVSQGSQHDHRLNRSRNKWWVMKIGSISIIIIIIQFNNNSSFNSCIPCIWIVSEWLSTCGIQCIILNSTCTVYSMLPSEYEILEVTLHPW